MEVEGSTGSTSEKHEYKYSNVPIRGEDGEFVSVERSSTEEEALRDCIKAILEGDADALADVVGTAHFSMGMAIKVAIQAWRKDVLGNKVGYKKYEGGLLSAVYLGTMHAQMASGIDISHGDNATTLMAGVAVELDEPRIVDVMVEWDSHFRMGNPGDMTVNSTVEFFQDLQAYKCAARVMERREELEMASTNDKLRKRGEKKVLRIAKMLYAKSIACLNPLIAAALKDLVKGKGKIKFVRISNGGGGRDDVFTIGLGLLGLPEIMAVCSSEEEVTAMKKRVEKMSDQLLVSGDASAISGQLLDMKKLVKRVGSSHILVSFADVTKTFRSPETPAALVLSRD